MRRHPLQISRLLGVLTVAAMALAAGPANEQKTTTIVAGMVAHGPPQWPQYVGVELGWFKQDNIEIDFVTVGGSGAQQVAGGNLNIAHSGYPDFARASLRGAPVKIIINDIVASPYAVSAKSQSTTNADPNGKPTDRGDLT